jgi:hypothetical protein
MYDARHLLPRRALVVLALCTAGCAGGGNTPDAPPPEFESVCDPGDVELFEPIAPLTEASLVVAEEHAQWAGVATTPAGSVVVAGARLEAANELGQRPETLMVVSYDQALGERWRRVYETRSGAFTAVASLPGTADVIVVGKLDRAADLGGGALPYAGSDDVVLLRLDGEGRHVWSRAYGTDNNESVEVLAVDADGNVYLAGDFEDETSLGGGTLTGGPAFVASVTACGEPRWSVAFDPVEDEQVKSIWLDPAGEVHLLGEGWRAAFRTSDGAATTRSTFPLSAQAAGLDAAGRLLIAHEFDATVIDERSFESWELRNCSQDASSPDCEPIPTDGTPWYGYTRDALLARFDGTDLLSATVFGGPRASRLTEMTHDPSGRLVVAGAFDYALEVDGELVFPTDGSEDGFLAIVQDDGSIAATSHLETPADDSPDAVAHLHGDTFVVVADDEGVARVYRVGL